MFPLIIAGLFFMAILSFIFFTPKSHPRLPPGPRALPVIGNLHSLGSLPHRALHALSQTHGPIMSVRLGRVRTVVISSPAAAEQVLKAHDTAFASRPKIQASEYLNYGRRGIAFTEYGPYWRHLRKLCTLKLLSAARIESFAGLRRREVGAMVGRLRRAAERKEAVDLSESVSQFVEELTFRMIVGSEIDSVDFKGFAMEGIRLMGTFNPADYLPFLGALDLLGLTRQMKKLSIAIDEILEKIIRDLREKSIDKESQLEDKKEDKSMSFVEVLLSMVDKPLINNPGDEHDQQDNNLSLKLINVKAIVVEMIAAGFDTTLTAIEWTLSELLKHPDEMARVQRELNDVVGMDRMVEEQDLPKLTYLEMAIMETFRLHPPAPLLVPRESMQDVEINGYFIPKKTRVLVNAWAIGRDASVWSDDVEKFGPQRFGGGEIGFRGNDFRFIPFGAGRRGCPGMQLGLAAVRLAVAQLMHCFSWELPDGMLVCDLDMTEKFGLTIPRANHLLAVPTFRLITKENNT